jgi:hypothetical protein
MFDGVFRPRLVIRSQADQVRARMYTVAAGPRMSLNGQGFPIFADGLIGVAHGRTWSVGVDFLSAVADSTFVAGFGGGVWLHVNRVVGLQADIQYRRTNLFDQRLNMVQAGVGLVLSSRR